MGPWVAPIDTLAHTFRTATLLAFAVALAACGVAPTASERWCEGLCDAVYRCGFHPVSCVSSCMADRPGLANLSVGLAEAEAPCLSTLSCGALRDDEAAWEAETDACWKSAVMSVAASSRSRDFCAAHARFIFDCGYIYSLEDCAQDYAVWSDDVLSRMARCQTTATCETLTDCERQTVEGP